ncbi:MAG: hypothetical protein M1826_001563 [Phylliscum demangeonii]|nr:MAG: hypothetical protein M1826_001563 [Phylliscum demangeonii]
MSSKNVSSSLPRPIRPASAASSVHENFKGLSIDKKPDISPAVLRWREQLESRKSSHGRFGSATSEGGNCHDQKHLESSPRPSLASMTPTKRVSFPTALSGPPSPAGTPGDSALKGEGLPLSPTSAYFAADDSPQHRLQQMNDQAANARTERKVLDLEISNSSLMAINRTLEREMRKQNAELRRFRRLSRSGRLSLATSSARTLSGHRMSTLSDDHDLHCDLSDLSETVSEMVSSEADSIDDTALSPDAQAASDARHWERDEKRLQLDLSKHQRLLVDSQKMNQSLKKCLGWTEELISEGKKALAFKVRLSDIGGRVLALDDVGHNAAKEAIQEKEGTDAAITVERGAAAE